MMNIFKSNQSKQVENYKIKFNIVKNFAFFHIQTFDYQHSSEVTTNNAGGINDE